MDLAATESAGLGSAGLYLATGLSLPESGSIRLQSAGQTLAGVNCALPGLGWKGLG